MGYSLQMDVRVSLPSSNSSQAAPPVPWRERHGWEGLKALLLDRLGGEKGPGYLLGPQLTAWHLEDSEQNPPDCSSPSPKWASMEINFVSTCELSGNPGAQQGM